MSELKIVEGSGLLTVQEAASYLRVKPETIYHWTFQRTLPVVKLGRLSRYRLKDLQEFIAKGLRNTNETA